MSEGVKVILNVEKTCRTCLTQKEPEELRSLLENDLNSTLSQVANIDIPFGPYLPKDICLECLQYLDNALKFRNQVHMTEAELRNAIINEESEEITLEYNSVTELNESKGKVLLLESFNNQDCFLSDNNETEENNFNVTKAVRSVDESNLVLDSGLTNVIKWAEAERKNENQEHEFSNSLKLPKFRCDLCSKCFRFEFLYKAHLLNHGTLLECDRCLLMFKDSKTYLLHVNKNHPDYKPYACPSCESRFFTLASLKMHFGYHTIKKHKCDSCGKTYKKFKNFMRHKNSHKEMKSYECHVCSKSLAGRSSISKHLKIHKQEKKHKCNICEATFIHRFSLTAHFRTHTGEKPFACKLCDNKFKTASYLKIHLRIHMAQKPYVCSKCPKSFVCRSSLVAHEKGHTGEKKFQCEFCGFKSSRSADLQTHIRKHTGEKPYKCEQCDKGFKTASNLAVHRKSHLGLKEHRCDICSKSFGDPRTLKSHIRIHTGETPYMCHVCGQRFKQSGQLSGHRKMHQETAAKT